MLCFHCSFLSRGKTKHKVPISTFAEGKLSWVTIYCLTGMAYLTKKLLNLWLNLGCFHQKCFGGLVTFMVQRYYKMCFHGSTVVSMRSRRTCAANFHGLPRARFQLHTVHKEAVPQLVFSMVIKKPTNQPHLLKVKLENTWTLVLKHLISWGVWPRSPAVWYVLVNVHEGGT